MKLKRYLTTFVAATAVMLSPKANAAIDIGKGLSIDGFVEATVFSRTNQSMDNVDPDRTGMLLFTETTVVFNINGNHETQSGNVIWRVSTQASTDYRYDSFGQREAWVGLQGDLGSVRVGHQFSNIFLYAFDTYALMGAGHLFADTGLHSTHYGKAISYQTPNFNGFTLDLQYDVGGYGNPITADGETERKALYSFAAEVLAHYAHPSNGFEFKLGGYHAQNDGKFASGTDTFSARTFNSAPTDARGTEGATGFAENRINVIFTGFKYKISAVDFTVAYKSNIYSPAWTDKTMTNHQGLAKVGLQITDKDYVNVGYQIFTKMKNGENIYVNGISSISSQYNRTFDDNFMGYVQLRYTKHQSADNVQNETIAHRLDGIASNKKHVSRILVGIFYGL